MDKRTKEVLIFILDNLQGVATGTPLDWRHADWAQKAAVAFTLIRYGGDLNKGADLFYNDEHGYYHPSPDRLIPPSQEELDWYAEINKKISDLNAQKQEAFESFLSDLLPLSYCPTTISPILGTTPDPLVKTIRYVDPLILNLDGDGLEITPLSKGILFHANGDAIKNGTAWAGADDGMLVWDRNGNGLIDSGRELFGDETILANGQKAAHGFAALGEIVRSY
jgi:hypothetical protein